MRCVCRITSVLPQVALLTATLLLSALTPPTEAAVVSRTGKIKRVPGYPGAMLDVRVGAEKNGDKTAGFWLQIKNPQDYDIKLVVCGMINLKDTSGVDDTDYYVSKVDGKWKCEKQTPDPGPGMAAYHFGCKQVTIPANGKVDVFDANATFDRTFEADKLAKIYFDVLKDCPLVDCDGLVGANKFLAPKPGTDKDFVNIWADMGKYFDLTDTGKSFSDWFLGNWITMNTPAEYPSRMLGTVTGAPAGSVIAFHHDGRLGGTYVVQPDPSQPPCGGLPLAINELAVIPPHEDALASITVTMPQGACGIAEEGACINFEAEVFAEEGAPFYEPGEFMYAVAAPLVRDTQPPQIATLEVKPIEDLAALDVFVAATDATTMVTAGTFRYVVDGAPHELPLDYATPSSEGELMFFSTQVVGLPTDRPFTYTVDVLDDLGNKISTPPVAYQFADVVPAVLDLVGGRFEVAAFYRTRHGVREVATPIRWSDTSGYFHFASPDNVEVTVKVLDACQVNGCFWAFASGMTNVEVELQVTDTVSGQRLVYKNPMGRPFQPLQDTTSMNACF